jgi:hypothetical protein
MHYKNGRPAKNGDKVLVIPSYGAPYAGILYDAVAGNDYCNGFVAVVTSNASMVNLKEVLHIDDVAALGITIPDSSAPPKESTTVAASDVGVMPSAITGG